MKKNAGDLKMSLKQARKLVVLERLCEGRISNREAASYLDLSVRQTQRAKSRFSEVKVESLIHGNTGGKPPNYVAEHIRDFVAQQAITQWKGASSSHMSELLLEEKGFHLSAKTITRILKERGIKNPFTHKGPKKHRRRERKKRFGEMVQIDASPFDWLCNGSMLSLHGAIDDATGKILALWLKPKECLFQHRRKGGWNASGVPCSTGSSSTCDWRASPPSRRPMPSSPHILISTTKASP